MNTLSIEYLDPASLGSRPSNPRTHSKKQIRQIADSIRQFGFTNPVLIDRTDTIIAGHGRVSGALLLGLDRVPTVRLESLSEAEIRAYVIADNRLAECAGWDDELLAIELQDLIDLQIDTDLGLDVTVTGFDTPQIDLLLADRGVDDDDLDAGDLDDRLAPAEGPAVTCLGDLWQIGPHRLYCGDAIRADSYARLMAGDQAQMVFTDPPYNVPIDGHVSGLGKHRHREFAMASGEMSATVFTDFLTKVFGHLANYSADGSLHFVCMDWRHIGEVLAAGRNAYDDFKNLCVWSKSNGGMGSLYRSQHELVFLFKTGRAAHINNVELGKHGRNRTNVWHYPGVNSFGRQRDSDLARHPTAKPVRMVADAIRDCSHHGGIILDAFAGGGTTLVAAAKTGRRGYGLELDPLYCDVIIRRMVQATGLSATLLDTGEDFGAVEKRRVTAPAEGNKTISTPEEETKYVDW